MNSLTIALSGIVIGAYILYKATKRSPFWNIPGPKSNSFVLGHVCELLQNQVGLTDFEWQENYGDVVRFKGSFGSDYLMISDPKALQRIFQTSGYRWRKTPQRREFSRLVAGKGLAWADGDVHKRQRKIMLPGFSAPEAKHLLPFFSSCAAALQLCSRWTDMLLASSEQCQVFNVADWISRATLDAIGQAAFDYDFGATNNQDTELSKLYQNLMIKTFGTPSKTALLMLDLSRYIPLSVMEFLDNHNPRFSLIHRVNNLAHVTAKYLVDMKLGLLLEGKNKKDIMSLLVKANKEASQNPKLQLNEEELLAQMRVLLFAGHETSGTSLTFALFELVRNPELQTRLRKEIRNTERKIAERGDVEVTAQDLESMPFLNAVVKETLRFHPVAVHLFRVAVEDDVLPLMKPIVATTGEILQEVVVPKGTRIVGSIPAYNRHEDVFGSDAFTFNPDRWLNPGHVKNSVSLGVYANLATFSAGIRSCIGWRFAVLEMQAFLVELIKNFEFAATPALDGIRREPAFLMTPSIEGELDKGSQMPLKVAFAKRSDDDS
ncbi:cytochrome P450 [Lentinula edodes]|uniref:cytochrome P450 n=1 Tax=Lentinula edodes TaxID=5353 RepID=UPI001E8CA369|nr:cytochrome P450 [Lentinula edodes]KAH7869953.1 cytochrome P450 [Lentinula edodes]